MKEKITTTYIDLDGVLINFTKGACRALNIECPKNTIFDKKNGGEWIYEQAGGRSAFWKRVHGFNLWANLEPYPWSKELLKIIHKHTNSWAYLTKPSIDSGCWSGKYTCVNKHFNYGYGRLAIVEFDKSKICHGPQDLLIDDKAENCEKWRAAGGAAYHWVEVSDDWPQNLIDIRLKEVENILHD